MYTQPSISDLVRSVIIWLERDVAKELTVTRTQMNLQMALVVLQWVIQRVEREPELLALEHNEMAALYRDLAEMFSGEHGPTGERLRTRAQALGETADLPAPISLAEVSHAGERAFSGAIDLALATMACHGSLRAGERVSSDEVAALLQALDDVDFAGHCPHGRPIVHRVSYAELELRVGRR